MRNLLLLFLLVMMSFLGFWFGSGTKEKKKNLATIHPQREYPLIEQKKFACVVYANNDTHWCERTLRSIFEQDYEPFRVIFIDDASSDDTVEKVGAFVLNNQQDHRVLLIQNETEMGKVASLYRAIAQLSDEEVVVLIDARDWLTQEDFLKRLNGAYQNPDVWMTFSPSFLYPSYTLQPPALSSFYASLFKQIPLTDLYQEGRFVQNRKCWVTPLTELAEGRCRILTEPYCFFNESRPTK